MNRIFPVGETTRTQPIYSKSKLTLADDCHMFLNVYEKSINGRLNQFFLCSRILVLSPSWEVVQG